MADKRKGTRRPQAIASLLSETFRGRPIERRLEEAKIWQIWDQAVGRQLAAKARPSKFHDGLLTVVVISAPWMQQLNFMKRDIAQRLNQMLGKELVREIYLKAGRPAASEKAERSPRPSRRALTGEEMEKIAQASQAIRDVELRQAFARLMETHFSTESPDKKE